MMDQSQYPNWFNDLLRPEEHVLWQGSPKQGGLIKFIVPVLLFIVFVAFITAIGWEGAPEKGTTIAAIHLNWASIFLAAFLLFLYLAVIVWPRNARTMQYLITNQRILIKSKGFREKLESYDLDRIVDCEPQKKQDGSGEIYFSNFSIDDINPEEAVQETKPEKETFQGVLFGLENVDKVMIILQSALAEAKKQS
jgi:hypothetical protein